MEVPADERQFPSGSATAANLEAAAVSPPSLPKPAVWDALPVSSITAFFHGFLGGVIGGIAYNFAPAWLQLRELPFPGASIIALATILGAFEVWRVAQVRESKLVRTRILFVLLLCLVVLLTVAGFTSTLTPLPQGQPNPVRIAPRKIVVC